MRDYDALVAEAMAMALDKMTKAGMPESVRIARKSALPEGVAHPKSDLFNKAVQIW